MSSDDASKEIRRRRSAGESHDPRKALSVLWINVLDLAIEVEATLGRSVQSLRLCKPELVAEVRTREELTDWREVGIERECLRILALHAPVASNLRRVLAALRVGRDLERMSDLAEHIVKRAKNLMKLNAVSPLTPALEELIEAAMEQVRAAVQALRDEDAVAARAVLGAERGVDRLRTRAIRALKESIRLDPDKVDVWLALMNSARHLERIADHSANIAENVVYLKEGEIIRHTGAGRAAKPGRPAKTREQSEGFTE